MKGFADTIPPTPLTPRGREMQRIENRTVRLWAGLQHAIARGDTEAAVRAAQLLERFGHAPAGSLTGVLR